METPSMDNLQSASTETVIRNHGYNQRERESLAFRLDKLNDKKCRYVSHESFLKKCLENNLVPNGLKVYVEPSIGNRSEEFLTKWHARLDEFSKILATDVIEFCEKEIEQTTNEIAETSEKLKNLVTTPEYTEITKTISVNEKSRNNELVSRKNRKFYRLKYNKTDDFGQRNDRNNSNERNNRNERYNGNNSARN